MGLGMAGLLVAIGVGAILVQPGGLRASRQMAEWFGSHVRRKMFPEQNAAGPTYDDTAHGPVALAGVIARMHASWPGESVAVVHGAACEVVAGLLHQRDIEVGSLESGKFVSSSMSPWQAEEKIRGELGAMPTLLTDESRYVFRRKPATH